jgi:hypothetical protein
MLENIELFPHILYQMFKLTAKFLIPMLHGVRDRIKNVV